MLRFACIDGLPEALVAIAGLVSTPPALPTSCPDIRFADFVLVTAAENRVFVIVIVGDPFEP